MASCWWSNFRSPHVAAQAVFIVFCIASYGLVRQMRLAKKGIWITQRVTVSSSIGLYWTSVYVLPAAHKVRVACRRPWGQQSSPRQQRHKYAVRSPFIFLTFFSWRWAWAHSRRFSFFAWQISWQYADPWYVQPSSHQARKIMLSDSSLWLCCSK